MGLRSIRNLKKAAAKARATARPAPKASRPKVKSVVQPKVLSRRVAARRAYGLDEDESYEMHRILGVPIERELTDAQYEQFQRDHVNPKAYREGFRANREQAQSVHTFLENEGRLFAALGVGHGKTLISLMAADLAMKHLGIRKVLLMVPSSVLTQLTTVQIPLANEWVPLGFQPLILGGKSAGSRRRIAQSNRAGLYIMPYSILSQPDGEDLLRRIEAGLFICDEAHNLANLKGSARARRVMSYVDEAKPKGVCLSGTMTDKGLSDYAHLISWCLGDLSPVPKDKSDLRVWQKVLNSDNEGTKKRKGELTRAAQSLNPLLRWGRHHFPGEGKLAREDVAAYRKAYQLRLTTCPAVVISGDASVGSSLVIYNHALDMKERDGWEELERLMRQVSDSMITPTGELIDHRIHTFKWLYELSAGCYNKLVFPSPEDLARRHRAKVSDAEDVIEIARISHEARQAYFREFREWIKRNAKTGLDTPLLVGNSMRHHGAKEVGEELFMLWDESRQLRDALYDSLVNLGMGGSSEKELRSKVNESLRESEFVRVCDYKVHAAVEWAKALTKRGEGGIIWVKNVGLGDWIQERLREELPARLVLDASAGDENNAEIIKPSNAKRIAVASVAAHGEGKNLQHWGHSLYVQFPRNAKKAEQSIGRTHRNGQKRDEVWVHTLNSTPFDHACYAAMLMDALYTQQSLGVNQKVLYATYGPRMPRVASPEVLRERGQKIPKLTPQQRRYLRARFS